MSYIGRTKTPAPLTSADIPDGIVTAADLAPDSVGTSEIADSVTLVTPNLGTPSAGVVTNLSGVLPAGVTGGSGLTALGTIAGNTTFTNDITANKLTSTTDYVLRHFEQTHYSTQTSITGAAVANISGSNYVTVAVGATTDVIELSATFNVRDLSTQNYYGYGFEWSVGAFGSATAPDTSKYCWYSGRHSQGNGGTGGQGDPYWFNIGGITRLATHFGLSADTTYRIRLFGGSHDASDVMYFGNTTTNGESGVIFSVKLWS